MTPAPVVKWAGGKSRLLPELTARMPRSYKRYHEPFLGGGALFFETQPAAAVLSDANEELIGCYRAVRRHVNEVILLLAEHRARHSDAYFYEMRSRWNEKESAPGDPERAAAFIYLNKTCYNGLWRVNSKGRFNVPVGRYTNPTLFDAERLQGAARLLRHAVLAAGSFERVLDEAEAGDFVYFDPPYVPVSATANFASYTKDVFGLSDQKRLAQVFRELDERGCAVMASNSDAPVVRRLYAGFKIERVFCSRAINSNARSRGAVREVIISNRY